MRWRRRRCCAHVAGLLSLLSLLGVLVILSHQDWLSGSQRWWGRHADPSQRALRAGTKGNRSSKLILRRGVPEPPASQKTAAAATGSPREDDSSPRGVMGIANSLANNTSTSEEAGLGERLSSDPYPYIINEPDKCPDREPAPFLVLLIATEARQVEARDAIRQTWGNRSVAPGLGFVRLFLLGVREAEAGGGSLEAESQLHHDIIQQDYLDTYNNLTVKTLMGMRWVATHCPRASYVMKTDSDMFVNTDYLVHKLLQPELTPKKDYFTGYLMRGYAPNRNKRSKWYMSPELYPGEKYPTFCSGTGYVLSGDLAGKIYGASLGIKLLHLEDVYVGVCLAKLRVEPTPPPNEFLFNHWRVSYTSCKYSHLITSHQFRPNELLRYWHHLQSNKHNACINSSKDKLGRFGQSGLQGEKPAP